MGAAVGVGAAVGAAVGALVAPDVAAGDWLPAAVGADVGAAVAVAAGLGETTLTGLESRTTPHTVQVLCSVPMVVVVGAAATVQSVATWPGAGIISV